MLNSTELLGVVVFHAPAILARCTSFTRGPFTTPFSVASSPLARSIAVRSTGAVILDITFRSVAQVVLHAEVGFAGRVVFTRVPGSVDFTL
jgi:hypothetical protein